MAIRTGVGAPLEMPPKSRPHCCSQTPRGHLVVTFSSRERCRLKPVADFDGLDGVDTHQGIGKPSIEPIVERTAEARRHSHGLKFDRGADAVSLFSHLAEISFDLGNIADIGGKKRIVVDFIPIFQGKLHRTD